MNSPIEINVRPEIIEDLIIKSLEKCIPETNKQESQGEYLRCVNSKSVMSILGIGKKALDNLVSSKILEPIHLGDGFKFPLWQLEEFQRFYKGQDLSTFEKCIKAKEKAAAATATKD